MGMGTKVMKHSARGSRFTCTVCAKTQRDAYNLRKHMNTHKQVQCKSCERVFPQQRYFTQHQCRGPLGRHSEPAESERLSSAPWEVATSTYDVGNRTVQESTQEPVSWQSLADSATSPVSSEVVDPAEQVAMTECLNSFLVTPECFSTQETVFMSTPYHTKAYSRDWESGEEQSHDGAPDSSGLCSLDPGHAVWATSSASNTESGSHVTRSRERDHDLDDNPSGKIELENDDLLFTEFIPLPSDRQYGSRGIYESEEEATGNTNSGSNVRQPVVCPELALSSQLQPSLSVISSSEHEVPSTSSNLAPSYDAHQFMGSANTPFSEELPTGPLLEDPQLLSSEFGPIGNPFIPLTDLNVDGRFQNVMFSDLLESSAISDVMYGSETYWNEFKANDRDRAEFRSMHRSVTSVEAFKASKICRHVSESQLGMGGLGASRPIIHRMERGWHVQHGTVSAATARQLLSNQRKARDPRILVDNAYRKSRSSKSGEDSSKSRTKRYVPFPPLRRAGSTKDEPRVVEDNHGDGWITTLCEKVKKMFLRTRKL